MTRFGKDGAYRKARFATLLAVQIGVVIISLDISVASTALPAIALGIGTSAASTIWIAARTSAP